MYQNPQLIPRTNPEPNLTQSYDTFRFFLFPLLFSTEIPEEQVFLCYYVAFTRKWNDRNSARKPVIQSQGIQIKIQEFKPNPNAEPSEMHYALKASDFTLPDWTLKCSAVPI